MVSQQLPQGINRQGFDAAVEADDARPDASGVELPPDFMTPDFRETRRTPAACPLARRRWDGVNRRPLRNVESVSVASSCANAHG